MAQIGSYVPASSATLGLLDAVFTRMGAFDNMLKGESTFMVELSETADILKQASPRSLIILDELGRGTSTHDGVAIAQAVLSYVVEQLRSLTLFITHYQALARVQEQFAEEGRLRNVHMRFTETESSRSEEGEGDDGDSGGGGGKDVTFLYQVGEGTAHRSYGLNVAKLAGLPKGLLEVARQRSQAMEEQEAKRRLGYLSKTAKQLLEGDSGEMLEHLIAGVEQL
ncbi:DNA mismatch repair protein msh3 [Hortaea werneckii]|nr:DNA mismatch repair protein msh3 [Hortaea werneckii]